MNRITITALACSLLVTMSGCVLLDPTDPYDRIVTHTAAGHVGSASLLTRE